MQRFGPFLLVAMHIVLYRTVSGYTDEVSFQVFSLPHIQCCTDIGLLTHDNE